MASTDQASSLLSSSAEASDADTLRTGTRLSRWKFLGAAVIFTVGGFNTYYLPHLLARSGTAFLIQFATCYLLAAVPMLYMEIAMGQFTSASPWLAFEMISPAMAGIPAALGFNIVLRIMASSVWITHALALFGISLTGIIMKLPWADCMDMFGCYDVRLADRCTFASPNDTFCADFIESLVMDRSSYTKDTPLVSYLQSLLKEDHPMSSENFIPHPLLVVALLMVWLIANVAQNGGAYLLGNTSFIVIPVAVISLFMTVTTAIAVGDIAGSLHHYYQHRFNKLLEVKDWIVAAGHAVFILNVSTGGMIKLASSRPFHLPILRDVIIIAVVTLLFHAITLLSTTAIIDGYAARVYPYDTHDERFGYVTERRYLVMATVGEAFVGVTGGWILNALYFLGIAVVPLQKLATELWVVVSMLREKYNEAFQEQLNRRRLNIVTSLIVIFGFLVNLPFIMSGGFARSQLILKATLQNTLAIGFLQLVTVAYIYGFRRFTVNIRAMVGGYGPVNFFWWFNWTVISPFVHLVCYVAFFTVIHNEKWIDSMWLIAFMVATVIWLPINFILKNYERMKSHQPIQLLFQPRSDWGPSKSTDRMETTIKERALRVR